MSSIFELLASQSSLVEQAAEALPFQFNQCTHSLGHIRQAVYLCTTCSVPRGICSACSVACHTEHEQLELFPKRHFRCDCPTSSLPHACTLHTNMEGENPDNLYGQNFKGLFCRCLRPYDASTERETMIQCLACEDWYHESCLNLRERPCSREPTPVSAPAAESAPVEDDAASEASSSGLPPPLIPGSSYESMVCSSCVQKIPILQRYAGTPGILMVVRDTPGDPWKVIGENIAATDATDVEVMENGSAAVVGQKRPRSDSGEGDVQTKRLREDVEQLETATSFAPCLAPASNNVSQRILSKLSDSQLSILGTGDIFLTDGFRGRWCHCTQCLPSLEAHPYLIEEEETYEPPEDPDSGLSLEELGLRALQRYPRDRAIDGIRAFNEMRDELMNHLRPFAQEGKEVTEADIRGFFEARMTAAHAGS